MRLKTIIVLALSFLGFEANANLVLGGPTFVAKPVNSRAITRAVESLSQGNPYSLQLSNLTEQLASARNRGVDTSVIQSQIAGVQRAQSAARQRAARSLVKLRGIKSDSVNMPRHLLQVLESNPEALQVFENLVNGYEARLNSDSYELRLTGRHLDLANALMDSLVLNGGFSVNPLVSTIAARFGKMSPREAMDSLQLINIAMDMTYRNPETYFSNNIAEVKVRYALKVRDGRVCH